MLLQMPVARILHEESATFYVRPQHLRDRDANGFQVPADGKIGIVFVRPFRFAARRYESHKMETAAEDPVETPVRPVSDKRNDSCLLRGKSQLPSGVLYQLA
jgi:hypothetical protein